MTWAWACWAAMAEIEKAQYRPPGSHLVTVLTAAMCCPARALLMGKMHDATPIPSPRRQALVITAERKAGPMSTGSESGRRIKAARGKCSPGAEKAGYVTGQFGKLDGDSPPGTEGEKDTAGTAMQGTWTPSAGPASTIPPSSGKTANASPERAILMPTEGKPRKTTVREPQKNEEEATSGETKVTYAPDVMLELPSFHGENRNRPCLSFFPQPSTAGRYFSGRTSHRGAPAIRQAYA